MGTDLEVKAGLRGTRRDGVGRGRRESLEALLRARRRRCEAPPAAGIDTPDPMDVARDREEEAVWLAVLDRSRDLDRSAEEALERLEGGRYGLCASCGHEIASARLRALPFAVRCLACQELRERKAAERRHVTALTRMKP